MATIVNTTPAQTDSGNGTGFLLGVILLLAFIVLFLIYGLPLLTQSFSAAGPQVNVPDKINVNVQTPQGAK